MLAALQDTEHAARVYAETVRVRRWFGEALAENGIIVHPSQANFVLATFPDMRSESEWVR